MIGVFAEYLTRLPPAEGNRFVASVSHSGGRPILFLPPRESHVIPEGWTDLSVNDEKMQANFVKVAVNVLRRADSATNALPEILRGWFGENAGLPGTAHRVVFEETTDGLTMVPVGSGSVDAPLDIGRSYMRAEIPRAFGLEFRERTWQQGYVVEGSRMFLLVTLDKEGMPKEHRYGDRFLSLDILEWKSQNRHTQRSKAGQTMQHHAERGVEVHLLVRKVGKLEGRAAPFVYCGRLDFVDWEGEKPITVRWHLNTPL